MGQTGKQLSPADWLAALVVIVVWGLNFVVMRWGLDELSPLLLCALRFSLASLPFVWWLRRPPTVGWGILAAYGLAQGVGQFGLLFIGMQMGMPAGMASVVLQAHAFITLLLAAVLLGERPQRWQWWGLVVAIAGLVMVGASQGNGTAQVTVLGFALTLGAALMWACANLIGRAAAKHGPYEPLSFVVWSSAFPVLPLFALSLWLEGGWDVMWGQVQTASTWAWGAVVYLALLSTLLGYGLWTRLLQRYPASTVAPLSLLVPIIGLMSAMLLLGEFPSHWQWLGTAGVLLGMVINQFGGRWARGKAPAPRA